MAASNLRRGPFIELKRAGGSFRNAEANQVAADLEIRAPALARGSKRHPIPQRFSGARNSDSAASRTRGNGEAIVWLLRIFEAVPSSS